MSVPVGDHVIQHHRYRRHSSQKAIQDTVGPKEYQKECFEDGEDLQNWNKQVKNMWTRYVFVWRVYYMPTLETR